MKKMFKKLMQPINKTHAKNSNTEFFFRNGRNISQSLNHYINAIKNYKFHKLGNKTESLVQYLIN